MLLRVVSIFKFLDFFLESVVFDRLSEDKIYETLEKEFIRSIFFNKFDRLDPFLKIKTSKNV